MLRSACGLACKVRLAEDCSWPVSSRLTCRRNYAANDLNFGGQEIPSKPKFVPCGGASFMQDLRNPACDTIEDRIDVFYGYRYWSVLFRALGIEGSKALEAGANAKHIKYGIDAALIKVRAHLERTARIVHTPEEIAQAATAAANGDTELGKLVAKGVEKVGKDGLHMVARSNELNNEVEFVKAMKLEGWGFYSPYFITNKRKKTCLLKNPFVVVLLNKLLNNNVVQAVKQAMRPAHRTRPLLFIVEDVEEVEGSLKLDGSCHRKKLCIVRPPKHLIHRATWRAIMEDLAIFTGGQVVTREFDMNCIPQVLGSCKEVSVSLERMFIFGAAGDSKDIEKRCEQLRSAIKKMEEKSMSSNLFEERLARLSQAVRFKVGGASNCIRVDNIVRATKKAMKFGIVPGGGIALFNASKELDKLQPTNADVKLGVQLLQIALKMPVYSIASAAGFDGSAVVEKLLEQDNPDLGYDPATGDYVEMFKSGNVDLVHILVSELETVVSYFKIWVLRLDIPYWLEIRN